MRPAWKSSDVVLKTKNSLYGDICRSEFAWEQRLSIRDRHKESGGIPMPKLHCGNGWLHDSAHSLRSLKMDATGELHVYKYSFFKEGKERQHTEKPEKEWPTTFWWFRVSHMGSSCLIIFLSRVIFYQIKNLLYMFIVFALENSY